MNEAAAALDKRGLENLFDSIAHAARQPQRPSTSTWSDRAQADQTPCSAHQVLNTVGQLTRQLHDTLAELGYDRPLQECAAASLPDARHRLEYVVTVSGQAASRCLNAVELATPLQQSLATDAASLGLAWDALCRGESNVEQFKSLAHSTREYLKRVPQHTEATRAHLRDIVVAQEFHDLTSQVLRRVTEVAANLESQLLKLLVENVPAPLSNPESASALHGPAIAKSSEVVANQAQVDELLESLGF